jgi:signal transduction histidine kinase
MTAKNKSTCSNADLRKRAEELIAAQPSVADIVSDSLNSKRLLHELQVHQVELEMQNASLSEANQNLLVGAEQEKRHILEKEMLVKDLHDGIGGFLSKISMLAQHAIANNRIETYSGIMNNILTLAYEGSGEVRSFMNSVESSPSAWGDLLAELTEHCDRMFNHDHISVNQFSYIAPSLPEVGVFRYVNIVKISKEAIANIIKHANAYNVRIDFRVIANHFTLSIADDGSGCDTSAVRKRGVANMYARAGLLGAALTIDSVPNRGTTVMLSIPFDTETAEASCA